MFRAPKIRLWPSFKVSICSFVPVEGQQIKLMGSKSRNFLNASPHTAFTAKTSATAWIKVSIDFLIFQELYEKFYFLRMYVCLIFLNQHIQKVKTYPYSPKPWVHSRTIWWLKLKKPWKKIHLECRKTSTLSKFRIKGFWTVFLKEIHKKRANFIISHRVWNLRALKT